MTPDANGEWEMKEFKITAPGEGEIFIFASNESQWDVYLMTSLLGII